ncbi:MAG: hypothetical protein ACEY3M_10945 [Wolbachia sp.]
MSVATRFFQLLCNKAIPVSRTGMTREENTGMRGEENTGTFIFESKLHSR